MRKYEKENIQKEKIMMEMLQKMNKNRDYGTEN